MLWCMEIRPEFRAMCVNVEKSFILQKTGLFAASAENRIG